MGRQRRMEKTLL